MVTLQSVVQVTGTDTTATIQSTIQTTPTSTATSADHHIDVGTMQTHLDSDSLVNSNSKELATNEAIESSEQVTMDQDTQIKVEKNLLNIFGMKKRPTPINRANVVIPDAMKVLYAEIVGEELRDSVHFPKPGLHTKSANTVRSFTHEGESHVHLPTNFERISRTVAKKLNFTKLVAKTEINVPDDFSFVCVSSASECFVFLATICGHINIKSNITIQISILLSSTFII